MLPFETSNRILKVHRRADEIKTADKLLLRRRQDLETLAGDLLVEEIDGDFGPGAQSDDARMSLGEQFDQEEAAVGRILSKDIAEPRRIGLFAGYYGDESRLLNGPNGVLSGRAAAEIRADDQNRGPLGFRTVEDKVPAPHVAEEKLSISRSSDHAEESSRDDSVRIDVISFEDGNFARMHAKSGHES